MWLLTRNGYFVRCLEASKISSNGFALDFFPLTVSPTGLKILGGGFVLLSDLASPWWPVILPFLKGWRAAGWNQWALTTCVTKLFEDVWWQIIPKFVDMASYWHIGDTAQQEGESPKSSNHLLVDWTSMTQTPLFTLRGDMILRPIPFFFEKKNTWDFFEFRNQATWLLRFQQQKWQFHHDS